MINVKLRDESTAVELSTKVKAPIVIEEQLDTSLDSGTLNYLITEPDSKGLNEALAGYSIEIGGNKFDFVGIDSKALLRREQNKIYTVNQSARVYSTKEPDGKFLQRASGSISGTGVKDILLVKHNFPNTTPTVVYDEDEQAIKWEVEWKDRIFAHLNPYKITIEFTKETDDDSGQKSSMYSHQVALTEPSKLLQGVMIDGFGVSQPEDYDSRKTLQDVVNRLLTVTPFDGRRFTLTSDTTVVNALKSVKSPEFKWNTQTTLWECLLQVGAVIDAMPRLVADSEGNYTVVTFDFVNAIQQTVDLIDDSAANVIGENVNESYYNTALSAIVENLRESE